MNTDVTERISVVGAGLMGHGIALQFALGGHEVALNDVSEELLQTAMQNIASVLDTLQDVGLVDGAQAASVPERIRPVVSLELAVKDADLVIEAVFEDLDLKRGVFARLDRLSPESAILSSNTSSFMSSQLATATGRPGQVVVANWWNPPYLLPLVEIVRGPQTSDHTIETVSRVLTRLGKRPVVLQKESLGFIGNRMQFALLREAISIVEHGIASAEDVDMVVKSSFGRRLAVAGPFEVFDMAGWDTIGAIVSQLFPEIERSVETPSLIEDMVQRGDLGVKTGKGFYEWTEQATTALRQRIAQALATTEQMSRRQS